MSYECFAEKWSAFAIPHACFTKKKKYNCIFELSVQFDKLSQRGFEVVMIQTGRTNLLGPTREKL